MRTLMIRALILVSTLSNVCLNASLRDIPGSKIADRGYIGSMSEHELALWMNGYLWSFSLVPFAQEERLQFEDRFVDFSFFPRAPAGSSAGDCVRFSPNL